MDVHGVILGGTAELNELTALDSYLSSIFIDPINQIIGNYYLTPNKLKGQCVTALLVT